MVTTPGLWWLVPPLGPSTRDPVNPVACRYHSPVPAFPTVSSDLQRRRMITELFKDAGPTQVYFS